MNPTKTKMRLETHIPLNILISNTSALIPVHYNDSLKGRLLDGYLLHQVGETESVIKKRKRQVNDNPSKNRKNN